MLRFDERVRDFIESPTEGSRVVIEGTVGSGKTTVLMERCRYMINRLGIPAGSILVMTMNREQCAGWDRGIGHENSAAAALTSFYAFVREELDTYYPLVLKENSLISRKEIKPVFISSEHASFLIAKVIEARRTSSGIFHELVSSDDRIASQLLTNLLKASSEGIPYEKIGERIYRSLGIEDEIKQKIFAEADGILFDYRQKCLGLGVFDYATAIDTYIRCLLKNKQYEQQLKERVRHLIVDDIEEVIPAATDFFELLLTGVDSAAFAFNSGVGHSCETGQSRHYTLAHLLNDCRSIRLGKTYTCSSFMYEASEMLFDNIQNGSGKVIEKSAAIERVPAFELRSEMLENIGARICSLICDEGYKPSDIIVLSTYADPVTEFAIGNILDKHGCKMVNKARNKRLTDNSLVQSLITIARLCYIKLRQCPLKEELASLFRILLNLDPVRSSQLAEYSCSLAVFPQIPDIDTPGLREKIQILDESRYLYVKKWIESHQKEDFMLPLAEFFQKAFLELYEADSFKRSDIADVKSLVDEAESFTHAVSVFNMSADKQFLTYVDRAKGSRVNTDEKDDIRGGDDVILTTPFNYLSGSESKKIIILAGISSNHWTPRSVRELSNSYVLSNQWNEGDIYTDEMEEQNCRRYLATLMRAVVRRCSEKLITFESVFSVDGFENDGLLSDYVNELLGGRRWA